MAIGGFMAMAMSKDMEQRERKQPQFYKKLETTKEYQETNYYKVLSLTFFQTPNWFFFHRFLTLVMPVH